MGAKTIKRDLIPYRAGVVVVIPFSADGVLQRDKAVATEYDFLQSTQTTVTQTVETLPNGNGADKDFITSQTYQLQIVANTYDPVFHNLITNRIEDTAPAIVPTEITAHITKGGESEPFTYGFTFTTDYTAPVADIDGNYNFIIEDGYGNILKKVSGTTVTLDETNYTYDSATKTLNFAAAYEGKDLRCIYYYTPVAEDTFAVKSNPILKTPEYRIEIYGKQKSADGDTVYNRTTILEKASYSGDVTDPTTQKSISNALTYTLKSAPVNPDVSVYHEYIEPTK